MDDSQFIKEQEEIILNLQKTNSKETDNKPDLMMKNANQLDEFNNLEQSYDYYKENQS